jgi:endoglucanase
MVKPYADEITVDSLGNLIVFKKGEKRRKKPLMVCAHMDEVGFGVRSITEDGMLKLTPAGNVDPRVLIGRRMRVGEKKIRGVIPIKAIHLTTPEERKVAPDLKSLYVDIGSTSKAQTEALVQIGDPVMFDSTFIEFGDRCAKSKAFDDRVGCAVMIKMLEQALPFDTWFVFSVGEEIGGGGARVAANRIEPGACLVIEGTTAADMPDIPQHGRSTSQRMGAAVSVVDSGTVYNRQLRDRITMAADKAGIKWQYRASANGGTDAEAIHTAAGGALAFGLSAPTRYIHSACNVVYLPDLDEVLKMAMLFNAEVGELDV